MSKFTPGPWGSSYRHDPITGAECAVWGNDGDMVAMVFADLTNDPDGTKTTKLIEQAPEMYKAITDIHGYYANKPFPKDEERLVMYRLKTLIDGINS